MQNKVKFFSLLSFLIILSSLKAERTVVYGTIKNTKAKTAAFSYNKSVIRYNEMKQTVTIDAKGNFKVAFNTQQMHEVYLVIDEQQTSFYIQPGDSLTIKINYSDFDNSILFGGKNFEKNNFQKAFDAKFSLGHEQDIYQQMAKRKAEDFLAYSDSILAVQLNFIETNKISQNASFTNYFKNDLKYKSAENKLSYTWMWGYLNRLKDSVPQMPYTYFSFMKNISLNADSILVDNTSFNYLMASMRHYESVINQTLKKEWNQSNRMKFAESILTNTTILLAYESALVENAFEGEFTEAQKIYLDYEKRNLSSVYLPELKEVYKKTESISPGHDAPAFTLADENGKKHTLEEFKGKIVYLDFWASWCGPCIREMPSSKKIRKEFEGKEIVFLYISIDEDAKSWKEAIGKHEVNGTNLIAPSFDSDLALRYNIKGVPSYFLISKEGKIINNNPPRPSSEEELKKELQAALNR